MLSAWKRARLWAWPCAGCVVLCDGLGVVGLAFLIVVSASLWWSWSESVVVGVLACRGGFVTWRGGVSAVHAVPTSGVADCRTS